VYSPRARVKGVARPREVSKSNGRPAELQDNYPGYGRGVDRDRVGADANGSALAIPFAGLGILFWSRASATGEEWADHNPALARWLLIGLSALAVLVALVLLVLRNP